MGGEGILELKILVLPKESLKYGVITMSFKKNKSQIIFFIWVVKTILTCFRRIFLRVYMWYWYKVKLYIYIHMVKIM